MTGTSTSDNKFHASFENGKFLVVWNFQEELSEHDNLQLQVYDRIEVREKYGGYEDITCAVQITRSSLYSDSLLIEPLAPLNLADGLYYAVYISSDNEHEIARSNIFTTSDKNNAESSSSSFEEQFLVDNEDCIFNVIQINAVTMPGKENCEIVMEWKFEGKTTSAGDLLTQSDYICIVPVEEVNDLKNVYYNHAFGLASGKATGRVSMYLGGYVKVGGTYQVCYMLNHQVKGPLCKGSSDPFVIDSTMLPSFHNPAATRDASQQYNMSTVMQYVMQDQMETLKNSTSAYNPLLTITPKKDKWSQMIDQAKNDHKEVEDELLVHLDDAKKVEVGDNQNEGQIDDEDDFINENEMARQITTAMNKMPCFLFAGAGISMAAPSSAPSWWKLMSDVLEETLKAVPEELQYVADKLHTTDSYRRPEEVMETYYFILQDKLFDVFKLLNEGRPNTNHKTIAKMAKEGRICTILTTNFDEFIEQALDDEAIKYRVICTNEEYREYFENGCEEFAVLKIHGTISRPETIIAVASHYKTSGGFDGYKSAVAHHFIKTVPTIFFGYSGWDFTHANYQEFWDAAGRAGGENIYFMRRKGSRGGPLLSKLVGRHIGDRLVIGEGDLPLTAISIFESFNSNDAKELLQGHNDSSGMGHKSIQQKQRKYIRFWVHEIPTASLLAIVWNESIYLNEGTNLRLEKTRQRRVKKDSAASMISGAETDSITAYLMDLATKLAQGKITNEEYTENQKKATVELSLATLMVSKTKKENIMKLCLEELKNNSLLIESQDYQALLPSYVFSIADVADDSTTPNEIINAAVEYIVEVLEPLRMKKDNGDVRSKILYELYHTQVNLLRIPEDEQKDIHQLFSQFADKATEQKWSEEERTKQWLEYITPVVNRVAYHQIDTQAIVQSMVNHIIKLSKDGEGIENIVKDSHVLALSLHKQAAFFTSDLYRLDEVQKLFQMFSMDVNKEIKDVYYEKVETKLNKITQPLLDLLNALKKKALKKKRKYSSHIILLEEVLSTFELANAEILRLLFKNSSTLVADELRRESCGYYPRDTLPPSVATYLSKKTLKVSKHIHDERSQQACLGMLCVLGESSNDVNQMRASVDKSMVYTEGKVTETTPCPIPEALAAQYQERGDLEEALHYYKLALEGIRTFVPRQKTDSIVLNACLVQAQYDKKEALKMAFEFSPFFNEIQQYSIVGPARGILVQQCIAWAGEFGISLEDAIEKFMNEDKGNIEEDGATTENNSDIFEDDNRRGEIRKKRTIVRHSLMGGGGRKAIQRTNTCLNCIVM